MFDLQEGIGSGRKAGKIVGVEMNIVMVRNFSGTGIEGAPVGRHLRPVLAVGVKNNPLLQERMPAELMHVSE